MTTAPFSRSSVTEIPEPAIARLLFADTRLAPVWLLIRLYVGYAWLTAGWGKLTNPLLFILATWLVLARRVSGYWGLDRWALRLLGAPGAPGTLFQRRDTTSRPRYPATPTSTP